MAFSFPPQHSPKGGVPTSPSQPRGAPRVTERDRGACRRDISSPRGLAELPSVSSEMMELEKRARERQPGRGGPICTRGCVIFLQLTALQGGTPVDHLADTRGAASQVRGPEEGALEGGAGTEGAGKSLLSRDLCGGQELRDPWESPEAVGSAR